MRLFLFLGIVALITAAISGCLGTATTTVSVEEVLNTPTEITLEVTPTEHLATLLESGRTVNAGNIKAAETYYSFVEAQFELSADAVIEEGAIVMYPVAPATEASSEGALPSFGYSHVSAEDAIRMAQQGITAADLGALQESGHTSPYLPVGNFGNLKAKETYFSLVEVPTEISGVLEKGSIVMYPVAPVTEASSEGALPYLPVPVR